MLILPTGTKVRKPALFTVVVVIQSLPFEYARRRRQPKNCRDVFSCAPIFVFFVPFYPVLQIQSFKTSAPNTATRTRLMERETTAVMAVWFARRVPKNPLKFCYQPWYSWKFSMSHLQHSQLRMKEICFRRFPNAPNRHFSRKAVRLASLCSSVLWWSLSHRDWLTECVVAPFRSNYNKHNFHPPKRTGRRETPTAASDRGSDAYSSHLLRFVARETASLRFPPSGCADSGYVCWLGWFLPYVSAFFH